MPKRKKKQKQITEFYAIEILDWDLDYGINLSPDRIKHDLDVETYSLVCHGKMVFPKKIAGRELEARFRSSRYMSKVFNEDSTHREDVNAVGGLHVWGTDGNFLVAYIPHDVIPSIISALSLRKINYISMFGDVLSRGHATIRWFNFEKDLSDWDE